MEINWEDLRAAASAAMTKAYAPYSNFPVGVAGLVDDGRDLMLELRDFLRLLFGNEVQFGVEVAMEEQVVA
jgi:hypothetical protein